MEYNILTQGQRIRKLRRELNINQDELGGEKFSKNYISMFENNRRQINAINAAFLAQRINQIAKMKNRKIDISASYFLKTEEDLAKDKCDELLYEIRNNYELTTYNKLIILNNIINISEKFDLRFQYGEALFLKGIDFLNRKLYYCSTAHFLECINIFINMNEYNKVVKVYKYISIVLFDKGSYYEALLYLNNAHNIYLNNKLEDTNIIDDIMYYKCYSYIKIGQIDNAKRVLRRIENKDKYNELNNILK